MTRRQTNAAAFLFGLSPLLQVVPNAQVKALGGAGWLGCLAALPGLLLLGAALKRRPPRGAGRAASFLLALWLAAAAATALSACAARYDTAVGVFRSPLPYAALLLLTALPAALSEKKALFRAGEIFLPAVLFLLTVGLVSAASQLRPARLIDLRRLTPQAVLTAAAPVFVVGAGALVVPRVFARERPDAGAAVGLGALAAVVCAVTAGMLGAPLTERLELPLFTMLRNTSLLHTVERLDALVAAVWILPDVTALTLLLTACGDCAARALCIAGRKRATLGAGAAAAAGAAALLLNKDAAAPYLAPVLCSGVAAITLCALLRKKA